MIREERTNAIMQEIGSLSRARTDAAYALAGALSACFDDTGKFSLNGEGVETLRFYVTEFRRADRALENVRIP